MEVERKMKYSGILSADAAAKALGMDRKTAAKYSGANWT